MPIVRASGSASPTVGGAVVVLTEQVTAGVYVLEVDAANLVTDDVLVLSLLSKVRPTDTARVIHSNAYRGGTMPLDLILSDPVVTPHFLRAELRQTAGTARTFPWALTQIG